MNSSEPPNRHYHPYSLSHDHAHGSHSIGCPRCSTDEANITPSPTASSKLGNLGTHLGHPQNPPTLNPSTTTPTTTTYPPSPILPHADPNWSALTTTGGNALGGRSGGAVNGLMDIMEQLKNGGTRQFGMPSDLAGKVVAMQKNSADILRE